MSFAVRRLDSGTESVLFLDSHLAFLPFFYSLLVFFLTCVARFSANMMLTKDLNTLKLADFGMSKKMSLEERTQVVSGLLREEQAAVCILFSPKGS